MRDQQERHAPPRREALEQPEHIRLGADIERGSRLVRDQQLRIARKRRGEGDALPHPAGELKRIAASHPVVAQPHLLQPVLGLPRKGAVPANFTRERLENVLANRLDRVEHREWVLEQKRDTRSSDGPQHPRVSAEQRLPGKADTSVRAHPGGQEPYDRPRGHRLAAT